MSPGEQFLSEIINSITTLITLFLTGFVDTFFSVFNTALMEFLGISV